MRCPACGDLRERPDAVLARLTYRETVRGGSFEISYLDVRTVDELGRFASSDLFAEEQEHDAHDLFKARTGS